MILHRESTLKTLEHDLPCTIFVYRTLICNSPHLHFTSCAILGKLQMSEWLSVFWVVENVIKCWTSFFCNLSTESKLLLTAAPVVLLTGVLMLPLTALLDLRSVDFSLRTPDMQEYQNQTKRNTVSHVSLCVFYVCSSNSESSQQTKRKRTQSLKISSN